MKFVMRDPRELKSYEKNPRINDNVVPALCKSIREHGFRNPILLNSDGLIIAGETRKKAAIKEELKLVPCIVEDDMTPEQVRSYRIADNKLNELAEWEEDYLREEITFLRAIGVDMEALGFSQQEINDLFAEAEELADDTEAAEEPEFHYKEQYGVIVMCRDEVEQIKIYEQLVASGYECKVVAT